MNQYRAGSTAVASVRAGISGRFKPVFRTGFTLIELLLVVLIIGILSAVAVPQYQTAVEKTRAMGLLSLLSSLARAEEAYYLATGSYTGDLFSLDIDPPADGRVEGAYIRFSNGNGLSLSSGASGYMAGGTRHVQLDIFLEHTSIAQEPGIYCYGDVNSDISLKICQSMGKATGKTSSCGLLAGTPVCKQFKIE